MTSSQLTRQLNWLVRLTGIAELRVSNPGKPEIFLGFAFATAQGAYLTGMIFSAFISSSRNSNI